MSRPLPATLGTLAVFGALLVATPSALGQPAAASRPSVAVVPLANESGDAAQDAFADGMTDELAAALTGVSGLDVVARSSAFLFKQTAEAKTVGQAVNAGYLVQGSASRSGSHVRLRVRLVQTRDGMVLTAQDLEGEATRHF